VVYELFEREERNIHIRMDDWVRFGRIPYAVYIIPAEGTIAMYLTVA